MQMNVKLSNQIGRLGLLLLAISSCCISLTQQVAAQDEGRDFDQAKVFDEVVSLIHEHFFDRHFDFEKWDLEVVENARKNAIAAKSHDEFSKVLNDELLDSLNASHTRYFSKLDPARYQLLGVFHQLYPADRTDLFVYEGIGIRTKVVEERVYVLSVYDGLPAAEAGIRFGDEITSLDGQPFHATESFVGKAGESVEVKIRRAEDELELDVEVVELDGRTMFEVALESSIRVIKRDDISIGYIHAWSYAGTDYQEQIRAAILWGELSACEALVLDLRDGWGGADINNLNLFREPIAEITAATREGEPQNYTGVWGKPVALLTNRYSTSGKELFTFGFKKLKLGKVFGENTAGAVVGGRAFMLSNDDVLYLAVTNVHVDGVRLEGRGVAPDFEVPWSILDPGTGDPQLEAAIEFFSKEHASAAAEAERRQE